MQKAWKRENARMQKDDRGVALVSVLIVIMLSFILSATIMRASYLALLSRGVDLASTNNFYSAEGAIDEVKMQLQKVAATSFVSLNTEDGLDQTAFINKIYDELTSHFAGVTPGKQAEAYLKDYLDGVYVNGELTTFEVQGGLVRDYTDFTITIEGVHVEYTDPRTGYVSDIVTDIVIRAPYYASSERLPLGTYSMFAGMGATVTGIGNNPNQWGNLTQEGNVYLGYMTAPGGSYVNDPTNNVGTSMIVRNYMTFTLSGDNVVINGDIYIEDYSNLALTGKDVEIRGTVHLKNHSHLIIGEGSNVVLRDIEVEGQSVRSGGYTLPASSCKTYAGSPYYYYQHGGTNAYHANASSIVYLTSAGQYIEAASLSNNVYKKDGTLLSAVTLDPSDKLDLRPLQEYNGAYYDQEFLAIVDVPWFEHYCASPMRDTKEPRAHLAEGQFTTVNDANAPLYGKHTWAATNTVPTDSRTNSWNTYQYSATESKQVKAQFGQNIEISNPSNGFCIFIGNESFTVPMNSGNSYGGLYMSTKQVTYTHGGNETIGISFFAADTTPNKQYLKAYMDDLGMCVMNKDYGQIDDYRYAVVNNFFNGGIKIFYEAQQNNGTPQVSVDTDANGSMNMVDVENWNKN